MGWAFDRFHWTTCLRWQLKMSPMVTFSTAIRTCATWWQLCHNMSQQRVHNMANVHDSLLDLALETLAVIANAKEVNNYRG